MSMCSVDQVSPFVSVINNAAQNPALACESILQLLKKGVRLEGIVHNPSPSARLSKMYISIVTYAAALHVRQEVLYLLLMHMSGQDVENEPLRKSIYRNLLRNIPSRSSGFDELFDYCPHVLIDAAFDRFGKKGLAEVLELMQERIASEPEFRMNLADYLFMRAQGQKSPINQGRKNCLLEFALDIYKTIAENRENSQEIREQAIINKHCVAQILGLGSCKIIGLEEIRALAQGA